MEAKEFRIDNLVYKFKDDKRVVSKITGYDLYTWQLNGKQWAKIEPIKLTTEWFNKAKFIKDDYSKYGGWLSPEFNKSRIRITIRNNAFIYNLNENSFIELKYVHKLQNLVYELTGGNELEIK